MVMLLKITLSEGYIFHIFIIILRRDYIYFISGSNMSKIDHSSKRKISNRSFFRSNWPFRASPSLNARVPFYLPIPGREIMGEIFGEEMHPEDASWRASPIAVDPGEAAIGLAIRKASRRPRRAPSQGRCLSEVSPSLFLLGPSCCSTGSKSGYWGNWIATAGNHLSAGRGPDILTFGRGHDNIICRD